MKSPRSLASLGLVVGALLSVSASGMCEGVTGEFRGVEFIRAESGRHYVVKLGEGTLRNEASEVVAEGELARLSGFLAILGRSGATFSHIPAGKALPRETWMGEKFERYSLIDFTPPDKWVLKDDSFCFLIRAAGPTERDLLVWLDESLARASVIRIGEGSIRLWGHEVVVGEGGGALQFLYGKLINGTNADVKMPDGTTARFPDLAPDATASADEARVARLGAENARGTEVAAPGPSVTADERGAGGSSGESIGRRGVPLRQTLAVPMEPIRVDLQLNGSSGVTLGNGLPFVAENFVYNPETKECSTMGGALIAADADGNKTGVPLVFSTTASLYSAEARIGARYANVIFDFRGLHGSGLSGLATGTVLTTQGARCCDVRLVPQDADELFVSPQYTVFPDTIREVQDGGPFARVRFDVANESKDSGAPALERALVITRNGVAVARKVLATTEPLSFVFQNVKSAVGERGETAQVQDTVEWYVVGQYGLPEQSGVVVFPLTGAVPDCVEYVVTLSERASR